ncbi:MAG TPA: hypothetical protein VK027_05615 [Chitinophagaceae bacterium]|nr:hypothetical protein [Chitinophagaceae bacterium]
MKKKLTPLYREKEIYTLFYDTIHNKLYRFPHRNKSSFTYIGLFILVLYGSTLLNDIYQPCSGPVLNIALFLIAAIICYFIAKSFMKNYYIQKIDSNIFFDENSMEDLANKGMKQFRTELNLGVVLGMILAAFGSVLFFIFSQIELLIIACLGLFPLFLIFLTYPLTRKKILKKFQNKEIKL